MRCTHSTDSVAREICRILSVPENRISSGHFSTDLEIDLGKDCRICCEVEDGELSVSYSTNLGGLSGYEGGGWVCLEEASGLLESVKLAVCNLDGLVSQEDDSDENIRSGLLKTIKDLSRSMVTEEPVSGLGDTVRYEAGNQRVFLWDSGEVSLMCHARFPEEALNQAMCIDRALSEKARREADNG